MAGKAVATVDETKDLVVASDEQFAEFFEDGELDNGFGREDIAIPFIRVLQSLSPQLKKNKPEYVEGANEGDFYNTVTGKVYPGDAGIYIIPVKYTRSYTEWRPRNDNGGGIVKDHGADPSVLETCHKDAKGKDITPDGNEVLTAGMYYVYLVDPETGEFEQGVMSLSGTQLKKARKLNSLIAQLRVKNPRTGAMGKVASFYMCYHFTTVPESNSQGSWMGLKIVPHKPTFQLPNGMDIYRIAKDFREMIEAGRVKTQDVEKAGLDAESGTGGSSMPDEEIPF